MPRSECADETGERFMLGHAKLAPNCGASYAGLKFFRINAIWIDDNFFVRNSAAQQIPPFDCGDHKDSGRHCQIQTLETRQQRDHAGDIPVLSNPNFRPVVFQKERYAGAQARFNSSRGETTIALIDQVDRALFDLSQCARRKNQIVMQIESRAAYPDSLGMNYLQRQLLFVQTRNTIVAYESDFGAQLNRRVHESIDVRRSATCWCAGAGRTPQISHRY